MDEDTLQSGQLNDGRQLRPFADNVAGHYFRGDDEREQRLDLLVHLIPYGGVLLVWGEPGVGKTALLDYLETGLNGSCRLCRLDSEAITHPHELVRQMLECFVWQTDQKTVLEGMQQLQVLHDHLSVLRRNGYAPVIMIDNAQQLSDMALDIFGRLLGDDNPNAITLVLAGGPELKKRLVSPIWQPLHIHVVHELEWLPFSPAELKEYIRAHLSWVGIDDMGPFHAAALKFIYAASHGVPKRINELGRVFWAENNNRTSENLLLPRKWQSQLRYVAPIVLVSLGIALFNEPIHRAIFPPEDNQTASLPKLGAEVTTPTTSNQAVLSNASNPASTESAPVLAESAAPVPVDEVELSPSSTQQAAQNANVTSGSHDVSLTNDGVPNAPSTIDHQVQAVTAAVVARSQTQLAAEDARPVLKSEQVTSQSWLTQPSDHYAIQLLAMEEADANRFMRQHKLESSVTTYWVKGAEKTLLAVAVGPFAGKDEAQSEAREWQQRLPGIQPWVRSVASIQQAAQAFEQRPGEWMEQVKTDEQTLLQEPATDYAVQIMAMDRKAVTGFINEHGLADQVVYFRTRVNGREQYAALMRGFADRDQALAAGHRLATEYKGVRPWVRSLASVQQGIRLYEDHPR